MVFINEIAEKKKKNKIKKLASTKFNICNSIYLDHVLIKEPNEFK